MDYDIQHFASQGAVGRPRRSVPAAPPAHGGAPQRAQAGPRRRVPTSRQVWRTAGAAHPARHGRRRRRRRGPVLLFLCIVLTVAGVLWLLPAAAETEPQPAASAAGEALEPTAAPYNGETYLLAIDAGHGGEDPGALSADGKIYESTITREMLNRLTALFAARQPDAVQVLHTTAEGETMQSREDRAAVANSAGADLFLSLHLNDNNDTSVHGFQVFAQPPRMATSADSVRLAELLAAQVGAGTGLKLIGGSGIYYMYFENSYTGYPYEYTTQVPEGHQGLDTYGVLQHVKCPSLLVEQWFITSSSDMAAMYTDGGMDSMAECIYAAVCQYFGLEP